MGIRFWKEKVGLRRWVAGFFKPFRRCKEVPHDSYLIQKYKQTLPESRDTGPYKNASAAIAAFQKKLKIKQKAHLKLKANSAVVDIKTRKKVAKR